MRKSIWILGAALLAGLGAGEAVAASKAGSWNLEMNLNMAGMPQIPPEALAQMRAMGMSMPGMGAPIKTQVCHTAAQAAADEPPVVDKSCTNRNIRRNGQTVTGEVVCMGEMNGTGTFEHTQISDEQYRAKFSFKGTRQGQPADFSADIQGRWAAPSC